MKIIVNADDTLRRVAKDMVKKKGMTPQEASERTGVPVVAEILGNDPQVLLANYTFIGSDQLNAARTKLE